MNASEHLGKIYDRILATNWGKGSFVIDPSEDHPLLCVLGLMHWTAVGDEVLEFDDWGIDFATEYPAHAYLVAAVKTVEKQPEDFAEDFVCSDPACDCDMKEPNKFYDEIVPFNDHPATTREDIAAAVLKAKELAEAAGN